MEYGLIDCDLHPTFMGGASALHPYLSAAQKQRLGWLGLSGDIPLLNYAPPGRAPHFTELLRRDCIPPDGGPPASNVEYVRTHYLDGNDIAAAMLIPIQGALVNAWTYPDEAAWYISAMNDYFCDHWLTADDRFNLDMLVSPLDPKLAADEIRRVGPREGVVGIWMPMIDQLLGQRAFHPVYQAAQEVGLPLMIHSGPSDDYIGTPRRAGGIPSHYAERYSTLSQTAMSNLASLIFEGVFERFPGLRVAWIEFGWTWVGPLLWRMDATYKASRRHHPWMTKSPTEYVLEHVRFSSEPMLETPPGWVERAIEMMHGERTLMYSSDYPHWDSEDSHVAFKNLGGDLRRRIFRDNALEFLGDKLRLVEPVLAAA